MENRQFLLTSLKSLQYSHSQDLSYKEMEEELTCPVCLELYSDPLMLPCSHSICKVCLQDIMTSRSKAGKQGLECPACRQNHYLNGDQVIKLPKNLALENIVFRYQEIHSCSLSKAVQLNSPEYTTAFPDMATSSFYEENSHAHEEYVGKYYCGICEEPEGRQAEWFCTQCQVFYCQLCLDNYHPKRGSLNKHKIRKPTLKESVECMLHCPDHNSESATIFCDTCKVVACHLCVCQGPGLHCGHVILDLKTARKKLQEAVQAAKNELSTLITSCSDKNSVINSHIQDIKDSEDSAKNIISSQYNCILSDIAATLSLVKQRSLESIGTIASQHSSHFTAHSQQIKTVLLQCQNLGAVCESLLPAEDNDDTANESSDPDVQHLQSFSDMSLISDFETVPSSDYVYDSDNLFESASFKSMSTDKQSGSVTLSAKSHSHVTDDNTVQPNINLATQDQKASSNRVKNVPVLNSRTVFDFKDHRCSSFSGEKFKPTGRDIVIPGVKTKGKGGKEESVVCPVEEFEDFDRARKNSVVQRKVEWKLSGITILKMGEKPHVNNMREDGKQHINIFLTTREEKALGTADFSTVQNSFSMKAKPEDRLLIRAGEVGPVLKQVDALVQENECGKSMDTEDTVISSSDEDKNILTFVSGFHTSCLALLSNIAGHFPIDYPVITPAVRSVATPSLGKSALPRVQSRTLITWGFNSTTFTADPLEGCSQWTVNVSRNTSHIGDIKTGYLFGIGVSTKPLSSKEQVGMTAESHAIACIGGQLVVCQNSVQSVVMPLTELPVCASIAITVSKFGLVMAYKILVNGTPNAICGQRVIALGGDKCVDGSESDNNFEFKVYPVFTVSQRVKMQFPKTSNV